MNLSRSDAGSVWFAAGNRESTDECMNKEFLYLEAVLTWSSVGLLALPTHQVDGSDDLLLVVLKVSEVHFEELGEHFHVPHSVDAVDDQAAFAAG